LNVAENTLVMFLSDNGACPYDFNDTPDLPPGPVESYRTYDSPWANAGNTPFRLYKQWGHEGGVSTPLIVRWPGRIKAAGTLNDQFGHIIDLMPTCVELAEVEYPDEFNGHPVLPLEGISLVPALTGGNARTDQPVFWEYKGNRAVRIGNWKLVAERAKDWELYNIRADRSELNDLIDRQPERAAEMARLYDDWAKRAGAESNDAARALEPSTQPR
jgi:arylsulfatase A-like enzyme